jgi:glyoxylase-like metal-dependent hydrolase (beta-lactamase superfamily II)
VTADQIIHRFPAVRDGAFVNAYLVETESGVVAVDGLLQVSAAREMRAGLDRIGKPLYAVLLTQSHPDHYAGLGELVAGYDVPIIAPQGVIDTIIADDASKDQIIGPMFGDEWPQKRVFPDTAVNDGESLTFDDATFTVIDLGPSESPHDSPWVLGEDAKTVFLGDQILTTSTATSPTASTGNGSRTSRSCAHASPRMPSSTSVTAGRSVTSRGTGSVATSTSSSTPFRAATGRSRSRQRRRSSRG